MEAEGFVVAAVIDSVVSVLRAQARSPPLFLLLLLTTAAEVKG